jgi:dihydroorotase
MSILIKKATIIDAKSIHHLKKMDILIERGKITSINASISAKTTQVIEGNELVVSPGWMDVYAQFNDPGFEHKEDLISGAKAAKNGGFSAVVISSNNQPVTDTKAQVKYFSSRANELPIQVKTLATLSEGLKGKNFAELYDLNQAGALGFSDGHAPIIDPDLLRRSLLYAKTFNGKIMVYSNDQRIAHDGVMHEGKMSTSLGLKSEPSLSEEIMVARDIAVAEYCDSPLHFMTISTAGAVKQIKRAKKRGIQITCDVAIANLVWNDTALAEFDSNFKVTPPLRSEKDRKALIAGINDGTIDFIVTNHSPQNIEEKQCEFDLAEFGQSSIETAFSLYSTYLSKNISVEKWVEVISTNSRQYFNQELSSIHENEKANLTVFNLDESWIVKASDLNSKSKNTPVLNTTLKGRVVTVIC